MNKLKQGIIWGIISNFSKYALQFGTVMILARLLSPQDYGLIGLLTIFISVADIVVDSGLCGAIIKKKDAATIDYSTLTTYNLVVSLLLYIIYYFIAPFVARFYDQPLLCGIMRWYSLIILIFALTIAPKAKLTKDLEFKTLSLINIASSAIGLLVAIFMALKNFGAYSLVGQYLSTAFVTSLLIQIKSKYRFTLGFSAQSFREQFSFGINNTLANTIKGISENIYSNVIGITSSLSLTGYYTQSQKLLSVPVKFFFSLVDGTYFPIMSQIHDKDEFSKVIKSVNKKSLIFIIAAFALIVSLYKEIVLIMLGSKWAGTETTFLFLLVAGLFISWSNLSRNILKSTGLTFEILKVEIVTFVLALILLGIAYNFGYYPIVFTFCISSIVKSCIMNNRANKVIESSFLETLSSVKFPLFFSTLYLIICFIIHIDSYWISAITKSAIAALFIGIYLKYEKRS